MVKTCAPNFMKIPPAKSRGMFDNIVKMRRSGFLRAFLDMKGPEYLYFYLRCSRQVNGRYLFPPPPPPSNKVRFFPSSNDISLYLWVLRVAEFDGNNFCYL